MITTQLPLKNWKEIIEDPLALDTIVDKLANGTLHLKIEGSETMRKRAENQTVLDSDSVPVEIAPQ